MRVSFFQSLPVRLAGLILVLSGGTLLVLTEINRRAVERILLQQSEVQALQSTLAVADGLDAVIGAAERLARSVARDLGGRPLTEAELRRVAENLMLEQNGIQGFGIAFEPRALRPDLERAGVYAHRSQAGNGMITRDLASAEQAYWNRDWYREVIDKGVPVWSDPFFDAGGADRNVVRVAVPIRRETGEEPIGAVTAVLELDWLRRLAHASEFSDTSFIYVFSRRGRLIVHPNPAYIGAETIDTLAEKESLPQLAAIRQSVLARRQGVQTFDDPIRHRRVHVNYKPTKMAGWGVIVGYDEAEFLRHQRAFRTIALAYLGATLLLLGGIVIGVTRHLLRPLAPLAASADEIARRNLDCAIPEVARADEIGHLTRSFRAMRDALKAQLAERRWAAQSLEHQLKYNNLIIDSMGELVFVITKAMNVARINPAVTRATGFEPKELLRAPIARLVRLEDASPEAMPAVIKDGTRLFSRPARVTTKEGRELMATLTLVPLMDGGQVVGAVSTLRLAEPNAPSPARISP